MLSPRRLPRAAGRWRCEAAPFLRAQPHGRHAGRSLSVLSGPGGAPPAALSEKAWKKSSILCVLLVNSLSRTISQTPFACSPLLPAPAAAQAWVGIARHSRAGLLRGNAVPSAPAIFKCPLVAIPHLTAGISPSFLLLIPLGSSLGCLCRDGTDPALLSACLPAPAGSPHPTAPAGSAAPPAWPPPHPAAGRHSPGAASLASLAPACPLALHGTGQQQPWMLGMGALTTPFFPTNICISANFSKNEDA